MTRDQAIRTAAKWWTDKIGKKTPHNNGDNSEASFFACIFADVAAADICASDPLENKLPKFREELEKATAAWMDKLGDICSLCSDYGPAGPLAEAAKVAGINSLCFPFKTFAIIERGYGETEYKVRVSEGYAQPSEYIPACNE